MPAERSKRWMTFSGSNATKKEEAREAKNEKKREEEHAEEGSGNTRIWPTELAEGGFAEGKPPSRGPPREAPSS